ncbi:MAG TPA: ROK family transcriptional regulator [Propionibacteriaceae bacterium]|nr:ROK family transcriptional regulator [Propionibacteriaceae bacterium]
MIVPSSAPERLSPRDRTREEVYAIIRSSHGMSRSALSTATGLSSSTVGHAVARLIAEGRVVESTLSPMGRGTGSGRRAAILTAVPGAARVAGIDFGHQHFRVGIGDESAQVVDELYVRQAVDDSPADGLDAACSAIEELCARHGITNLAGVAVGVPGTVERATGVIRMTTILSNWSGMSPALEVQKRLGVPALVDNDATLGALGERHHGAGEHHEDFLYVKASHGVGAALVIDGEPYRGGTGFAGAIGHMHIEGRPELCRCGSRGCLEAVVSVPSVMEQISHTRPQPDEESVEDLATLTDAVSTRVLNEAGRVLGQALADLINLVNPTAVIIGGELGSSGPAFIHGVRSSVNRFAQMPLASACVVLPAQLGERAELVGALVRAGSLIAPGS